MESTELLVESSQQMLTEGKDLELILSFLRKHGCSKTQSIVILKEVKKISLDEAKRLVHFSQEWQDVSQVDAKLSERFYEVLINDNVQE
ncbi:hypothetical protein WA1_38905 [Scytonema hofmannii PCC 7110]|uniref:Uncharacterized protein n=1 Tax=Scytonema hofmannii PCC 7110 TaxID=128403 RepID=A0A139X0T3_9CYAN|nr:hypothetical protein [Scytonema hofmannii]KYC38304.1 hypothetical protein WA1_38905 [Scytonema hofmannii PCC 7110]